MPGSLQYDNGIEADVVLRPFVARMLSLERGAQSLPTLIARRLCEATPLHYAMRIHRTPAERRLRTSKVKQKVTG